MNLNDYFTLEKLTKLYNQKFKDSKVKGIDKINSTSFNKKLKFELDIINRKVLAKTYKFSPYVEKLKLKGRNKPPRIISIPTLRDRLVLIVIKDILHELFDDCVNRKLPNSYIKDIKEYISEKNNNFYYMKLDIEKFYDNIDRKILLDKLKTRIKNIELLNLIETSISIPSVPLNTKVSRYIDFKTEKGIPQGLSISNILAQIYISSLDSIIDRRKYFYRRYVDDIIILNDGIISDFRYKNIKRELENLKLALNDNKTEKDTLQNGFSFLSYKISPNLVSIADTNVEIFLRRVAGKFTWLKNGTENKNNRAEWLKDDDRFKEVFIEELNETITGIISSSKNYGWLFYFSEMNDISLLYRIDKIINKFFTNLNIFSNKAPKNLKKLSRAFMVIRHKGNKNYICNFDNYDSIRRKRSYLIFRGKINPEILYSDEDIENLFSKFEIKQIKNIEKDIGYNYF